MNECASLILEPGKFWPSLASGRYINRFVTARSSTKSSGTMVLYGRELPCLGRIVCLVSMEASTRRRSGELVGRNVICYHRRLWLPLFAMKID